MIIVLAYVSIVSYSNANIRIILIHEKALSMIETHTRYIDIYIIHMVYIVCVTLREREREREREGVV
mgnify:CR=1 FL=1